MARRDGTGPMGQGSLTGRGMGPCAGDFVRRPYGKGIRYGRCAGFGRGIRGRGFGPGFVGYGGYGGYDGYPIEEPLNTMSDKEWLNEERAALEDRLILIKKELDNIGDE